MNPQNVNEDVYVIAVDNTSKKADLKANYPEGTNLVIHNASDQPVYVHSNASDAETVTFPSSASTPARGQIVGAGATMTYSYNPSEPYIYAIQASAGTGDLFITAGQGV